MRHLCHSGPCLQEVLQEVRPQSLQGCLPREPLELEMVLLVGAKELVLPAHNAAVQELQVELRVVLEHQELRMGTSPHRPSWRRLRAFAGATPRKRKK